MRYGEGNLNWSWHEDDNFDDDFKVDDNDVFDDFDDDDFDDDDDDDEGGPKWSGDMEAHQLAD